MLLDPLFSRIPTLLFKVEIDGFLQLKEMDFVTIKEILLNQNKNNVGPLDMKWNNDNTLQTQHIILDKLKELNNQN